MIVVSGGLIIVVSGGSMIVVSGPSGAGVTIVVLLPDGAGWGVINMKYAISKAATTTKTVITIAVVE